MPIHTDKCSFHAPSPINKLLFEADGDHYKFHNWSKSREQPTVGAYLQSIHLQYKPCTYVFWNNSEEGVNGLLEEENQDICREILSSIYGMEDASIKSQQCSYPNKADEITAPVDLSM